jgi:MFS family permease
MSGINLRPRLFSATTNVLILLCIMYALTYIDRNNVSTAAFVFKQDLHLTNTQVGLVFSAFAYPYLIFQIVGGWVSDRFGARLALTASAVVWASATLLTGKANGLAALVCARLLLGFGEGATFPTATRAMSDWLPEKKRGFGQGITHASARLGNALTPPMVAWLIAAVTWRGSFIILGIISMAWAIVWGLYFRNDPASHPAITSRELETLPDYAAKQHGPKKSVPLWLYLAWIPSFFLHSYHLKLQDSAFFSAGVFFAGVVGNTLGGVLSDRILSRTGSRNKARRNLVVIGFLCSLASMLPLLFVHNLSAAAIFLSLAFFFSEFTIGPMWAIPMDIAPRFAGSASGLMNTGTAFGAIISPLVFGFVIDKTGNWELPFLGSIVLLFVGAILAFWMKPDQALAGAELLDFGSSENVAV